MARSERFVRLLKKGISGIIYYHPEFWSVSSLLPSLQSRCPVRKSWSQAFACRPCDPYPTRQDAPRGSLEAGSSWPHQINVDTLSEKSLFAGCTNRHMSKSTVLAGFRQVFDPNLTRVSCYGLDLLPNLCSRHDNCRWPGWRRLKTHCC